MIEINLLPEELRLKKIKMAPPGAENIPVPQIIIGVIVILIIAHVSVFLLSVSARGGLAKLNKAWNSDAPKQKEIVSLQNELQEAEEKVKAVRDLSQKRVNWPMILNKLSDIVPNDIWFSDMSFEKRNNGNILSIQGFAKDASQIGTDSIVKFVNTLKADNEFTSYFRKIEVTGIQNRLYAQKEVRGFTLICEFNEGD